MSESCSESSSDRYINGSPPATRRNLLFLDLLPDNDTGLRSSQPPEDDIPSWSISSERSSDPVDPFLSTSTPALCFAASSSPDSSPAKECLFPHYSCTQPLEVGSIHLVDPAAGHSSFVCHLDALLQDVLEQQKISEINGNARIHHPENFPNHKPQSVFSACDTSSDLGPVVIPTARGSRSFPLLHPDLRQFSPPNGTDPGGCVLSVASHDGCYVPARNKRKAPHDESLPRRSDSYLSASDCASPLRCRCSDNHHTRLKKQKCRSFDGIHPPGIPPTQPATRVPSPVPALSLQHFQEIEIPHAFASSEDAAEARLKSLLKKDVLFLRRKCSGALAALDFAPRDSFVLEVIAWILTVEPPLASAIATSAEQRVFSRDLHDQLTTHHDTRFLAALIFISFFFSVSARPSEEGLKVAHLPDVVQQEEPDDNRKMVVWDYAVAAVALAVKVHRDNLPPLRPIYARHFLAMAPHEMFFDDLEISQRDLLEGLSYDLGMPTPQAILDELHLALPTLRHVLDFECAWEDVLRETWKQLQATAHSPDMLRFPVALLTATALIEAITRVVCRHLSLMKLRARCAISDSTKVLFLEEKPTDEESRMLHATGGLFDDIRTVLGLSADNIGECEEWLATVRLVSGQPLRSKYFPAVPK